MLHIRLRRVGKKKQPSYRLIVCEKSKDPWGDYLENLGTYNPRTSPSEINLKTDRIKEWISKGAQCSDTVWNILVDQGVVEGGKRKTIELSKKRKEKVDKASADKAAAEEAKKAAEAAAAQTAAEEATSKEEAPEAPAEEKEPEGDVEATPSVAQQEEEKVPAEESAAAPAEGSKEEAPAEEEK
jgi:small subunit ribosomal protein S16